MSKARQGNRHMGPSEVLGPAVGGPRGWTRRSQASLPPSKPPKLGKPQSRTKKQLGHLSSAPHHAHPRSVKQNPIWIGDHAWTSHGGNCRVC